MKILAIALAIGFVFFVPEGSVLGQTTGAVTETNKCPLTVEQSPVVRGIKLGQTVAEVRSLFPEAASSRAVSLALGFESMNSNDLGVTEQTITSTAFRDSERLKGTENLVLRYLDGRVALFRINYDPSVHWNNSAHFAAAIAPQLHLPAEGWRANGQSMRLTCSGFYVNVIAMVGSQITISRDDLDAEISRRREKREQQ
ncbi:MAG TPA: hypothetical protein VF435_08775, partial [Pyrinomonadaceae bacterium]